MEKLSKIMKEKKYTFLLYIILFICLIYVLCIKIVFGTDFNLLIFSIILTTTIITYLIIAIWLEYKNLTSKIKWVNSIYNEFAHMQIFLDDNNIILEILEGEYEKITKLANVKKLTVERISNKNDLVKILVK